MEFCVKTASRLLTYLLLDLIIREPINSKPSIKSGNDPYVELSAQDKEKVARIDIENVAFPMMADGGSKSF